MLAYRHSGFSVDTSVCIAAHDRTDLERLLRYCARPPFALAGLREAGSELVYRCAKQHSEPTSDKRGDKWGTKADELHLTPLELIDRIAALVPPPRTHRHRYFWCARTQFAAQGCRDGDGLCPDATGNCTTPVIRPTSCHWRKRRRDKGPRADGPCNCSRTRAGAAQASGPLPVGGADCPHLRGVPAFVPAVRWADAHHRLYHAQCRYPAHPGAHRCRLRAPAKFPGSRAAVMGEL